MAPTNLSGDLTTIVFVVLGIAVGASVVSLYNYFFGGRSPLWANTEARQEAARAPAEVLSQAREFDLRKRRGCLIVILVSVVGLAVLAPEIANQLGELVWLLGNKVVEVLRQSAATIAGFLAR